MLVLSRSRNERIVFPQLDITVEILQIARSKVRIGVKAPPEIAVLRDELVPDAVAESAVPLPEGLPGKLSHELRKRLQTAQLAVQLSQKLLSLDRQEDAELALQQALAEFEAVDKQLHEDKQRLADVRASDAGRRALVVEDNANEGELLAAYLRASGFQVDTARDGLDAIDRLEARGCPDVMLLDMAMPRCDGPSVLRALRGDPRYNDLTIFAVTGSGPEAYRPANGSSRVDRWFRKPVNPEALVREMHQAITLSQSSPN